MNKPTTQDQLGLQTSRPVASTKGANRSLVAKTLVAGAGVCAAALLAPMVISAPPPANAVIGNQAGATYTDASGKAQTALSNLVVTTVAQVAGLTLTPDNTKYVAAGNTAYMSHTLTNTGNSLDSFKVTVASATSKLSGIAVYPDANGTGVPSGPALCSDTATAGVPLCTGSTGGFVQSVPAGSSFSFVVAYSVPVTAAASASTAFDTATVTATSTSAASITGVKVGSKTDTVYVTADAAFNAKKAIKAPGVAAAAGGTWPVAVTSGLPSAANCSVEWSSMSTSPTCTYTVYTVSYTNTGGAVGNFSMQDTIGSGATAGLTYVKGSAVWSGAGGSALSESGAATGTGSSQVKSVWDATSMTFKATVTNVAPNVSGTVSFVVLVNNAATSGTGTTNNVAGFWSTSCDTTTASSASNCNGSSTPPVSTNPAPFPILPVYSAVAANVSTATTVDSGIPAKSGENVVVVASAAQGATATFTSYVINKGTTTDAFNVSLAPLTDAANNTFPAGTLFSFVKEDGVTPMTDSNNDGVVDTGPLAAGASIKVTVKATLPTTAAVNNATPLDVLLTAASVGDASKKDYVWNELTTVTLPRSTVDLTNTATGNLQSVNGATPTACVAGSNCDLGQGPTSAPTFTVSTVPGTPALLPVFVANNTATNSTYNLTATVPSAWTVTYSTTAACPGTPITAVTVPANQQSTVWACVTAPVGSTTGTSTVGLTATSSIDPTVTDTLTDAVTVTAASGKPDMQLGPDSGKTQVASGGTATQSTTLTNTGTTQCGAASTGMTAKLSLDAASLAAGWSAILYFDKNNNGVVDQDDVLLNTLVAGSTDTYLISNALLGNPSPAALPMLPGTKLPLLVKIASPLGAANGNVATVTMTVTDTNTDAAAMCPADTAVFNTTVQAGQLRVIKKQALDISCTNKAVGVTLSTAALQVTPDGSAMCLVYQVIAENQGSAPVYNVVLNDTVPAYTTYAADNQPAVQCAAANGTVGTPAFVAPTGNVGAVSCGTATTIPPLGTLTMTYSVQIQN
jgi:hypothetical protein